MLNQLRPPIVGMLLSGLLLGAGLSRAAEPARPPVIWKLNQDFTTTLQSPGSGTWKKISLKTILADLSRVHRIFLLLDRRIDPDQQLDYTAPNGSLEVTLRGIAAHLKLGLAIGNGWVYFGPPEAAAKLRTLIMLREAEATAQLPKTLQAAWSRRGSLTWKQPLTPRELAETQLGSLSKFSNPEAIVNDLWEPRAWPSLPLSERLALILIQFDLTWQWDDDGQKLKLVPLPAEVAITRQYPTADPAQFAAKLKQLGVTAKVEVIGQSIKLTGLAEDQQLAADLAAGKQARKVTVSNDSKRYTLAVNLPVGKLLTALAAKLELTVEFDDAAIQKAGISLDHEIKLDVREVTRDALLTKIVEPVGLAYEIQGKTLRIKPK